ncbi:MlaD family protein [Pseudonocardia acaciae]|uniref:MlaD family protein n=1 Tax=Pseudonocardia acaciae TaxID=551276 RepID=UPI000A029B48|nr:MCE family protein [Pseudonocardia acaciae]
MRARGLATILAVLAMLAIGLTYLLVAVVQIDPFRAPMRITVNLARSGGLLDHSGVTYRGYPVGRVNAIELRPGGVRVVVAVDPDTRIPADTDVAVANLSAAGEQYLDFRPRTERGPFLADGAVIDQRDTRLPTPFTDTVNHLATLAGQIDPAKVAVVVDEMSKAFNGSAPDIARALDGGDFLLAGLEEVLPETVSTLRNGRIVLGTVNDLRPELREFADSGRSLTGRLRDADPTIRTLLDDTPEHLKLIDDVVREDGPSVAALLGDLGTVTHVVATRLPAISQFLPELARVGPAAALIVKDGKAQVLADLYPRPSCDYGTPRRSPTIDGSPPPRIYKYCTQEGPRLQQRGSANVPRPRGDDTAGPPPGADPNERARGPRHYGG